MNFDNNMQGYGKFANKGSPGGPLVVNFITIQKENFL